MTARRTFSAAGAACDFLTYVEQLRSDPIPENKAHLCEPQVWSTRHEAALKIAEKHGFGIHDALIVAAACEAGCAIFYSEDFQDGKTIDGQLTIRNPFARLCG